MTHYDITVWAPGSDSFSLFCYLCQRQNGFSLVLQPTNSLKGQMSSSGKEVLFINIQMSNNLISAKTQAICFERTPYIVRQGGIPKWVSPWKFKGQGQGTFPQSPKMLFVNIKRNFKQSYLDQICCKLTPHLCSLKIQVKNKSDLEKSEVKVRKNSPKLLFVRVTLVLCSFANLAS